MPTIPDEIKQAVAALDNEYRWRIVELLLRGEELSYTELMKALDIKKGNLTHHLNTLTRGSVIEKYSKERLGDRYDSYYALALFGQDIVRGLLNALGPSELVVPFTANASSAWVLGEPTQPRFEQGVINLMSTEMGSRSRAMTQLPNAGAMSPKPLLNATVLQ